MKLELLRRVAFTLGALFVFRLGTYIPIPGIDPNALASLLRGTSSSLFSSTGMSSGGAIHRLAIFALGIVPYVAAAIVLQLVAIVSRTLRALQYRDEAGRATVRIWTLGLTIVFATVQALGIALALESIPGGFVEAGWLFRLSTVATLVGGTMFLVWLSGRITAAGIGNGVAVILAAGILVEFPSNLAGTLELVRQGLLSGDAMLASAVIAVAVTGSIVVMERAQRRLAVDYAPRAVGGRTIGGRAPLVIKLNAAGIVPPLLASWLLALVVALGSYDARFDAPWWRGIVEQLKHGTPLFMATYAALIVLGAFFYTAFVLDPDRAADDLKKYGGEIQRADVGSSTADYLDSVITRTTMVGAVYLALVCLIPELLIAQAGVPFYLGGTSLLIVVCTVMDIEAQVSRARVKLGGYVDEVDPAGPAGGR